MLPDGLIRKRHKLGIRRLDVGHSHDSPRLNYVLVLCFGAG
jgi:hypothetical protein